ncbi:MAG: 50S ribosomal protein L31e [Candidatus Kariarchaeaceae archaeon]|jgi:large subunit ribosomal protein L31e
MSHQVVLERTYTIPFYPKLNSVPRTKRAPRAMRLIREFMVRNMKSDDILIDQAVNEYIWSRGIKKPPRKISVRVIKSDDDVVEVYLVGAVPEEIFQPEGIPLSTEPSEEELDIDEEDFEEDED